MNALISSPTDIPSRKKSIRYNGKFSGNGPIEMFERLEDCVEMGKHIKFVTKGHDWPQYFRAGDTLPVLFSIGFQKKPG